MRTRRAYLAELEARAARLEREREEQAERAVIEERTRIARELHDVIAHNVSVMVVQASAGEDVFDTDPARARESLSAVASTGRAALTELRRLLGVIRAEEDHGRLRAAAGDRVPRRARRSDPRDGAHGGTVGARRATRAARGRGTVRVPHRPGGADQHAQARRRLCRRRSACDTWPTRSSFRSSTTDAQRRWSTATRPDTG